MANVISLLLLIIILISKFFRNTAVGYIIHDNVVKPLARKIESNDRAKLLYFFALCGIIIFGGEIIVLTGGFDAAIILAWHLSIYIDAIIIGVFLSTIAIFKISIDIVKIKLRVFISYFISTK